MNILDLLDEVATETKKEDLQEAWDKWLLKHYLSNMHMGKLTTWFCDEHNLTWDQFNELKDKLTNKDYTLEQALDSAEKFGDDFKGNFELAKGGRRAETFLVYSPAKSKNWFQGKTGGSSGFGTAHG